MSKQKEKDIKKCGLVAVVGEPNAGKSTLVNKLVGGKISIVSPKVQTTRFNVRGVMSAGNAQLIFIDTPGIFSADKKFEKAMVGAAWAGMGDADCTLLLIDARQGLHDSTKELIENVKKLGKGPILLALNKVDKVKKHELFELAQACDAFDVFEHIFMISALTGDGIPQVVERLSQAMPHGPWLYPDDDMSDIPMRLLAAEITREKIFMKLDQELPYSIFVETESWEESEGLAKIAQVITVQREGQKKIVIGDKGSMIKAIGTASRIELAKMMDKKVHLELFVKVRSNWKENEENYRLLGLDFKN